MNTFCIATKRYGVTLVEVMISVAIISIIFMAAAAVYVQSGETTALVKDRSEALFEAQEAIERMVDTVRNCDGLTTAGTSGFTLTNKGTTTTFSFNAETHSIRRNNVPYAVGITGFTVAYFDKDGNSAATAAQVARIDIKITASIEGTSREIASSVNIRRKMIQ